MSPTPHGSSEERVRNLLFLSTPRLWPVYPFLPLIRRKEGGEEDCGVLYDVYGLKGVTGYGATVFMVNVFLLPRTEPELLAMPREVYDSAEEIFAAGWRIE
jgi:hypothetical protein